MWLSNRWLWRVIFIAAAIYFVVRGPWRAVHDSGDFLLVYTAARSWLHGVNPYIAADLAITARNGGIPLTETDFVISPSVYLPPALTLLTPLALLPWAVAKTIWLACLLALTLWNVVVFARLAKQWAVPVASFLLAFAPVHSGFSKGQPSVLVCGLIFLSVFTANPDIAGLLLGIAACFKPQLAIGFFLLAAGQRQFRKLIVACAVGLIASGIGVAFVVPGWYPALSANVRNIVGSVSGLNSASGPISWYQLVNLHILIPEALTRTSFELIAYAIIVAITAIAAVRAADWRMSTALIASATVLIGYHRFYEAQIMWFDVPAILFLSQKPLSYILWALHAVFLVPGQTMIALRVGMQTNNPLWALLLRHETIAVVLIWMIFAWITIRHREAGQASAPAWMKSAVQSIIVSVSP